MQGRSFEPEPLAFLSRQSFHPWLVVGVTCIVSAASSMMAWRLEQRGGRDSLDVLFDGRALLDAIESSLAVLVVFAVAVALISWLRPQARP